MTKKRKHRGEGGMGSTSPEPTDESADRSAEPASGGEASEGGVTLDAVGPEVVERLNKEQQELQDRYLRLAADFDNFRKRAARERSETWARAQAAVVSSLLDALDDLARVSEVDAGQTKAADVLGGVQLVERKILHALEGAGLRKLGSEGEAFDPNHHEAISALPAPSTDLHDQVAAVLQPGYRFSGTLLRPAKVQVFVESDEATE